MASRFFGLLVVILIGMKGSSAARAQADSEVVTGTPATRSVAAIGNANIAETTSAADLALHQYLYLDFPRAIQALADERALAEAELALMARRVDSFRPFRSFGRYGATYFTDQSAQIALLAARQRVACLADAEADLWRERQAIVAHFLIQR